MKRLVFFLLIAVWASMVLAHDFEVNGIYYVKNSDGYSVSVSYRGASSSEYRNEYYGYVTIPPSVTYSGKTYSVTSIRPYAFCNCYLLESVTIPNSVTSIGDEAFRNCNGLKSIVVEQGNTKYDSRNDCNAIIATTSNTLILGCKNTIIPSSVTSIGEGAFYGCSGLTSVTIPNSVTSIGDHAFSGSGLKSVTIPNSVTSIGEEAFSGCSGLTSVTIGNSVTSIGYKAFYGCSGLTSVTIPNSVKTIGNSAFYNCSGLTSVTIGNSVTSIGSWAFYKCSGLTSVTIGNSVTEIGEGAFYGCSGLTKVEVSDLAAWCRISFGSSESNPLYYAKHLYLNGSEIKDLVIHHSVKTIGDYAFQGCSGLTSVEITNSVTSIGSSAFSHCEGLKSVTIPNSVTSIGTYAFSGCSGLTSVTIGNSVTSIGDAAFSGCSGLTKVKISDIAAWCRISFGSRDSNPLYYAHQLFLNAEEIKDLVIPNSVTSIGDYAFCGCRGLTYGYGLTSVTIPNSVTSIGDYAFHECKTLTSVTIGNSVTSIGEDAFSNSGLSSVTIGNAVTSIGKRAFFGCNNLKTVNWNAKNCSDFSGNSTPFYQSSQYSEYNSTLTAIQTFNFGNEVEKIPAYLCCRLSRLTSVTIPDSVKEIGRSAFGGTLWFNIQPAGLVYAGKVAYEYRGTMPSGTSIAINEGTVSITPYCFSSCGGLTSVTIPNSVTSIGDYAFSDCSGLTSVVIPNSITRINSGTFSGCSGLKSVYMFPNSVTEICESAFSGCNSLSSITIANSVKTIGSSAFKDCVGLNCVTNFSVRPQRIDETVFGNVNVKGCALLVPAESVAFYKNVSYWQDFLIGVGVEGVEVDLATKEVEGYYDLKGVRLEEPIRGQVNIVRYTDGSTKKIVN